MSFVLPEAEVLQRAFSRRDPDLLLVHQVGEVVRARRLLVAHPVRQELLARCRDERQFMRLDQVLAAFPAPRADARDAVAAARIALRLRERGVAISGPQALTWAVAARLGALVWALDPAWDRLQDLGCPRFAP